MDRRLTPANARVALASLQGQVTAPRYTEGSPARIAIPVADLLARPDGPRDRQLLLGTPVTVLERLDGWAFVQSRDNGYVGYVTEAALGADAAPTHRVASAASHLYPTPSIKSREIALLSLGTRLTITGEDGAFARTDGGAHVIARHLRPVDHPESDPVAVAERLLGTPYLWGGDSREGIDCSGLVQLACAACAIPCPGDSDLQEATLGTRLPDDAPLERGDLIFWKGHVAWISGPGQILHANAHAMAVGHEGLQEAINRIEAAGEGLPTARKRLR